MSGTVKTRNQGSAYACTLSMLPPLEDPSVDFAVFVAALTTEAELFTLLFASPSFAFLT